MRASAKRQPGSAAGKNIPSGNKPVRVRHPLLWLSVTALCLYLPILRFGYTDLDDRLFINDQHAFYEHLGNIITAFSKNVMVNTPGDIYYRPIFSVSMILNSQVSGQEIAGYHFVNILLHVSAVLLLYKLLKGLDVKELHAFVLSMVFAVHPVLVMAVAWVPGRTDVLLTIFALLFLVQAVKYSKTGNLKSLAVSGLWLCLAFFSKEAAVFLPIAALLLLQYFKDERLPSRTMIMQYAVWSVCFVVWYFARANAEIGKVHTTAGDVVSSFVQRLPSLLQYTGKIFLPFNLSTFPNMQDTAYYWGVLAIILIGFAVFLNKQHKWQELLAGLAIFVLLMIPVLLVPASINKQSFEYRLYLPMLGVLLLLPQTVVLNNRLTDKQLLTGGLVVCCILAALNLRHQKNFESPLAFWSNAAETSPHDSYALMMLSARVGDAEQSKDLFQRAFALNPKERYVNYLYANMLQAKDSVLASEQYLLAEKRITGYPKADLLLSRVAREKQDYPGAIQYAKAYLKSEPADTAGNVSLLILYMEADMDELSVKQASHMDSLRLPIPAIIRSQIKYHQANR